MLSHWRLKSKMTFLNHLKSIPQNERYHGTYSLSNGIITVPDRHQIYNGIIVNQVDQPAGILLHELVHFFQSIESEHIFNFSLQCYFVLKAVQKRLNSIRVFSARPIYFFFPIKLLVQPDDCIYNLLSDKNNQPAGSLLEIVEGLAAFHQVAAVDMPEKVRYKIVRNHLNSYEKKQSMERYGLCYSELWRRLLRKYGKDEADRIAYHTFPVIGWLALREWRYSVRANYPIGMVVHPASAFKYFIDILLIYPPIIDHIPKKNDFSVQALSDFSLAFLEQITYDQQISSISNPDAYIELARKVHDELRSSFGNYKDEFVMLDYFEHWQSLKMQIGEPLPHLVNLHQISTRKYLLNFIIPQIRDNNGFRPAMLPNRPMTFNPLAPLEFLAVEDVIWILISGILPKNQCQHLKCAYYDRKLCNKWPHSPPYDPTECNFPNWLSQQLGAQIFKMKQAGSKTRGSRIAVNITLPPVQNLERATP